MSIVKEGARALDKLGKKVYLYTLKLKPFLGCLDFPNL